MKFFILVIKDIIKFMSGRKAIFIIIVLGLIFNTIGITFYYGYFMNSYKERIKSDNKIYSYYFSTNKNMNENGNCYIYNLLADRSKFPEITLIIASEYSFFNKPFVQVNPEYQSVQPLGEYSKLSKDVLSGRYFIDNEINQGLNVTIASMEALRHQKKALTNGDMLDVGGVNYLIVGQIVYSEIDYGSIIPLKTYINNNLPIKYMQVIFESLLTEEQQEYLVSNINRICPDVGIRLPPKKDYKALQFFWGYFMQIIALFTFTLINIFSLVYYWISTNTRKYNIFLICGCYKLKVFSLILSETLLISTIAFIIGNIIIFALKNLLINFGLFTNLYLKDYLILFGINFFISLGMSIYTGFRVVRGVDVKKV